MPATHAAIGCLGLKCRLSFATVGLIAKVDLPSHNDDPILQV